MREAVEGKRGPETIQPSGLRDGLAIEGVLAAVFFEREAEADFVRQVRCEGVVERGGEDLVVRECRADRERQGGRLSLIDALAGVAHEEVGFRAERLVEPQIVLIRVDVVPPRAEVVVASVGQG